MTCRPIAFESTGCTRNSLLICEAADERLLSLHADLLRCKVHKHFHRSCLPKCTNLLCSPPGGVHLGSDFLACFQQDNTHWTMLVVSSVAALLGGKATASSILMLGICCQQEVRTGVFSSDSCCRRQQLRVYFPLILTAHLEEERGSHTCAPSGCLWNWMSCRRFLCELFLHRGQRENWLVSCSAGETADARGAEVGEKAKLDVDSKFRHVSFTFWVSGVVVGCSGY